MQCNQCGADLPEEARFCHQCGAPVQRPESEGSPHPTKSPEGQVRELDFVQPALAGGTLLGLLSSLPLLNLGNCLCCMWVLGGGAVATFLLSKQQPGRRLTYGDGAFAGVLSGLFGAIVATIISIPMKIISARFLPAQRDQMDELLRNFPEMEAWMRDLLTRLGSTEISVTTVLFTFISNLMMYALFAMIGGILTVAILQKRSARPLDQAPLR